MPRKDELELQVSAWYNAFVDIMNYKSDVDELLSRIDSCQLYFDIVSLHRTNWNKIKEEKAG